MGTNNRIIKKLTLLLVGVMCGVMGLAQPTSSYDQSFSNGNDMMGMLAPFKKMLMDRHNTQAEMDSLVVRFNQHILRHPEDQTRCMVLLGDLYRLALPVELRNTQRAMDFYEYALDELPQEDSVKRGTVYVRLAAMYDLVKGESSLHTTINYLSEATRLSGRRATLLGDYFLFGWGVEQDLFLASTCYNLGIHNGSTSSNINMFYLLYLLDEDNAGTLDTIAETYFEHAIYLMQISKDWDSASYWLRKAAERDYAPAYYEIGNAMMNGIIPCDGTECEKQAWNWIEQASMKNYAPAVYQLAMQMKDVELMQRSAELTNPMAMIELGKYYLNKKKERKQKHYDPERAAYWMLLAAQFADNGTLDIFDSIVKAEWIAPDQVAEINARVRLHYSMLRDNRVKLLNKIKQSPRFGQPRQRNTFYSRAKGLQANSEGNTEEIITMVYCYRTLYELYGKEVKRYSEMPDGYEIHHLDLIQEEMKFMRQKAENLMPDPFQKSHWETYRP